MDTAPSNEQNFIVDLTETDIYIFSYLIYTALDMFSETPESSSYISDDDYDFITRNIITTFADLHSQKNNNHLIEYIDKAFDPHRDFEEKDISHYKLSSGKVFYLAKIVDMGLEYVYGDYDHWVFKKVVFHMNEKINDMKLQNLPDGQTVSTFESYFKDK